MKCCKRIFDGVFTFKSCSRNGVVERDGKHYCRQHDPVARQSAKDKRRAESLAAFEERMKVHRLHSAAPDLLEALEAILYHAPSLHGPGIDAARAAIAKAKGVKP